MGSDFALEGYTRRIARAVVEAMGPRWPDFEVDLTDRVLEGVEVAVRHFPAAFRAAFVAGLWALELAGPALGGGPRPFSWTDVETRERRLRRLHDSRSPLLRQALQLYSVFITVGTYSQPEVEDYLGVPRRAWREARRRFRERLVAIEEGRGAPPPAPAALGTAGVVDEDAYLEDEPPAAVELRAAGA